MQRLVIRIGRRKTMKVGVSCVAYARKVYGDKKILNLHTIPVSFGGVQPKEKKKKEAKPVPVLNLAAMQSVSIDQAAALLNLSRRTIYNRITDGRLQTTRTQGGSQRVLVESLYDNGFKDRRSSTSGSHTMIPKKRRQQ